MRNILRVCAALVLTLCASAPGGARITPPPVSTLSSYADPRNYGTPGQVVCGGNFTNDATHDDAPAIQRALAANSTVMLPNTGCKMVTQVHNTANGQRISCWGSGSNYSSPANIQPCDIYVPDAAASQMTNNCAFDTQAWDGVLYDHIGVYGNYEGNGTVAFCNSLGVRGAQSFAHFDHVDVFHMGNGIGAAMTTGGSFTGCDPTGPMINTVFQFDAIHIRMGNNCAGMTGNFSDAHVTDAMFANIQGPCIASSGAGNIIGSSFRQIRCEYNFDSFGSKYDGAGIYIDGKFNTFDDVIFDHTFGACMSFGVGDTSGNAAFNTIIDFGCQSSNQGAQFSAITNVCNFVFQGVPSLTAYGIATPSDPAALYSLCFVGSISFWFKWDQPTDYVGAGWTTAFYNGTLPVQSDFQVSGVIRSTTDGVASTTTQQALQANLNSSGIPVSFGSGQAVAVGCNSGTQGWEFTVTNASSPVLGSPVAYAATGGVWAKIDCNGSVWNVSAK
jgi:hypothetical protein